MFQITHRLLFSVSTVQHSNVDEVLSVLTNCRKVNGSLPGSQDARRHDDDPSEMNLKRNNNNIIFFDEKVTVHPPHIGANYEPPFVTPRGIDRQARPMVSRVSSMMGR